MKGSKKKSQPTIPNARDLAPLLELQQRYSQVGVETPFGSQQYRTNPDGSRSLVTSLNPQSMGLVNRALTLGGLDSEQVQVPQQANDIATQLANRVSQRFGNRPGGPINLSGGSKPPQGQQPMLPPQNTNQYGG